MTDPAADLATLRELLYGRGLPDRERGYAALDRVEAELARLREERDEQDWRTLEIITAQLKAADARCARLQQALDAAKEMRGYIRAHLAGEDANPELAWAAEQYDEALAGPDTAADSQEDKT